MDKHTYGEMVLELIRKIQLKYEYSHYRSLYFNTKYGILHTYIGGRHPPERFHNEYEYIILRKPHELFTEDKNEITNILKNIMRSN